MTTANKTISTDNQPGKAGGWVLAAIIALVIALIPFCYGKYYEFNTNDPFDGSLNIFHSHEILQGKKIGTDLNISAGPGTLLVNTIGVGLFGYSEFGPKLIQTIMQATALAFAFTAIRKLYGNIAAIFALVLGSFYLSSQPYAKFGNVKDQYMIACMIIAASSFIFYELNQKKAWLLSAGAFAINTWYFKPTGFSLAAALFAYLIITTIMRKRPIKQTGGEIISLTCGAGLGLIPLVAFYLWLGLPKNIVAGFPGFLVIAILAVYAGFKAAGFAVKKCWPKISTVNFRLVLAGLSVIVLAIGITLYWYQKMGEGDKFLRDMPVYAFLTGLFSDLAGSLANFNNMIYFLFFASEGYVANSSSVSSFATQLAEVSRYSHSFVVIIGLAVAAVVWSVIAKIRPGINGEPNTDQNPAGTNNLFILLALWWLCDMLFVWVSPRAYVQYFLAPNGSGMFLAGYIISRIGKGNTWAMLTVSLAWLAIEWLTAAQAGLSINKTMLGCALMVLSGSVVLYFIKKRLLAQIAFVTLLTTTAVLGNLDNCKELGNRVQNTKNQLATGKGAFWEQLGNHLRDNSKPGDTIYVWGWYPGIYVAAERSCPARMAAYSDMHTDTPSMLGGKISMLLDDLEKNKPMFIVDSQKVEYPHYDHPVFDLWPTVPPLHFYNRGEARTLITTQNELNQYLADYDKNIMGLCVSLSTLASRVGGPLPADKAKELAELEVQRHQKMAPLREFVLKNYTPYRGGRIGDMTVLKRK